MFNICNSGAIKGHVILACPVFRYYFVTYKAFFKIIYK